MKKALIHYFSGTGNTFHMAGIIGNRLELQGYDVTYTNMEQGKREHPADFQLHVFAYPIYAFGTPAIVIRYVRELETVTGCKASVVCSCGGFEGQSLCYVSAILRKKGFEVFLTDIGIYPDNWTQAFNPVDQGTRQKVFEEADQKIIALADKIGKTEVSIVERSPFNLAWSWIVFLLYSTAGRRILGKVYIADSSCTSCGKCEKFCPVKAIELKKGKPGWNWKCEGCQRCMNICPYKSIQTSLVRLLAFIILEVAFVFVLMDVNKTWPLPLVLDILLYCIGVILSHYIVDKIIYVLERIPGIRKLFEFSYTKKYGRYLVKDFKPEA